MLKFILALGLLATWVSAHSDNFNCIDYLNETHCDITNIENGKIQLNLSLTHPEQVSKVWVYKSTMQVLRGKIFATFSRLKEFSGIGIHIESIAHEAFWQAGSLEILDLRFNNISKLVKRQFAGARNIKEIHLFANQIRTINDKAFLGLHRLEKLFLGKNHLKTISAAVFRPLYSMQLLSLEANYLRELDVSQLLTYLPQLNEVALYGNQFTCRTLQFYEKSLQRRNISLTKNRIDCLNVV